MPGIVGLVTKLPRGRAESALRRMIGAIQHEAFYETGQAIDESQGVYVGWCERAGSFAGGMPLRTARGDTLVFSGEHFADTSAGTSNLIAAAQNDARFPVSLNGRFHGVLINRHAETTTLFNDRYGLHRLYWHEDGEAFYFAAEAKAILAVCPDLRTVDAPCLAEFVTCGCVLENRTLFKGIEVLPPGSAWVCTNGRLARKETYFQPAEWEQQRELGPDEYYEQLRGAFAANLRRYFASTKRVGVSLTGGFDTRVIMAWHKAREGALPCYTFGGASRDSHDVRVARRVAALCDQPHHVIRVGQDFLARFPHYAERTVYLTDGCADVSRSADLYVNEISRTVSPVRMTGNYGSEVLRGVRAFKPVALAPGVFTPDLQPHIATAASTYTSVLQGHPLSFAVFRQAPWHHYGLLKLEESQLSVRTPYLDNEFVRTLFRAPRHIGTGPDVSVRLIADGDPRLLDIETDRAVRPRAGRLSAVGRALREFSFKAEYAYDYGMPQWLAALDHAVSPLRLQRLFLGRHKFYHFRVWYRDALASYVRSVLLDSTSLARPYLQRDAVERIVSSHLRGDRNYTLEIHRLLTLELFHRAFVDRRPPARRPDATPLANAS